MDIVQKLEREQVEYHKQQICKNHDYKVLDHGFVKLADFCGTDQNKIGGVETDGT